MVDHRPRSHPDNGPQAHKPCSKCGNRIHLVAHDPDNPDVPLVRYFDNKFNELCQDCAIKHVALEIHSREAST